MNRRHFLQTSLASASVHGLARAQTPAPTSPERIPIAQIGVGHAHASGKMAVYRESADFEVVGVAEPDDALWARAVKTTAYRNLKRYSREQLLELPGLRAVAVESAVPDLLGHAESAIDAGMHVHLDKPAGESLPDFRRLMEKADAKNLTVQLGYMYRYNPAVLLLHEFLANGWLGDVFEVHAVMSTVVSPGARGGLARFSGGIMFELGCHIIDLVVGVLGRPDGITPYNRRHGGDGLVDNMLAVMEYPDALATVKSTAIEVGGFARRHFVVCGTEGTFHIQPLDRPAARITLSKDRGRGDGGRTYREGVQEIPFEPPYRRYVGDATDFAKIIRGGKESDFRSGHDLAVQESVLRASGMM